MKSQKNRQNGNHEGDMQQCVSERDWEGCLCSNDKRKLHLDQKRYET